MRVGDRVRCIAGRSVADQFTPGNIYVVRNVDQWSVGVVADDSGRENGWSRDFFELVRDDGREEVNIYSVFFRARPNAQIGVSSHTTEADAIQYKNSYQRLGWTVLALKKFKTRI